MTAALHIAIDASRSTVTRMTGTEHYSRQLIRHLIQHNDTRERPHSLHLYFRDAPADDLFPTSQHVTTHVLPFARLWTHVRFAAALWRTRPDVTFVPAHTLPLAFPGKALVTVHDLGYKHFPQAHPRRQRLYLDGTTRYSAQRATRVLADSQATADDLTRSYGTPAEKIEVVYPGVEALPRGSSYDLFTRYPMLPPRYFLFIGTLQPRKNIARLVEAYRMWQSANVDSNTGLVLAGKPGWLYDPAWVQGVENVYVLGYIPEELKEPLLRLAGALVFPSLYEGFGFPVIEAMHAGVPVIASNTSSLPELVGNAGLLVDPLESKSIAAAMDLLMDNVALRRKLSLKGLLQAQHFTWKRAAEKTLRILEAIADGSRATSPASAQ